VIVTLIYDDEYTHSEVAARCFEIAESFSHIVINSNITEDNNPAALWDYMEKTVDLTRSDYIMVLRDSDLIDDPQKVVPFVKNYPGAVYACKRYYMVKKNLYRMDGGFSPHLEYQLFPYMPGATLYPDAAVPKPTYVYNMHFVMEPHITILNFEHYNKYDTEKLKTVAEWELSIPKAAHSQGRNRSAVRGNSRP